MVDHPPRGCFFSVLRQVVSRQHGAEAKRDPGSRKAQDLGAQVDAVRDAGAREKRIGGWGCRPNRRSALSFLAGTGWALFVYPQRQV
jgi:hypothetical protein